MDTGRSVIHALTPLRQIATIRCVIIECTGDTVFIGGAEASMNTKVPVMRPLGERGTWTARAVDGTRRARSHYELEQAERQARATIMRKAGTTPRPLGLKVAEFAVLLPCTIGTAIALLMS